MKKSLFIFYSLLFIGVSLIGVILSNYIYDDAYIHFRIAENLVNNGVPYYNADEPFMSSSSTVWTLFLAFLYFCFGDLYTNILPIIETFFLIISLVNFKIVLEKELNRPFSVLEELIFAFGYVAITLPTTIGLMETPLALMLLSSSILFFQKNNLFGFAFLSIAIFTRLELAIFYLIFFGFFLINDRKCFFKIVVISFFSMILFLVYNVYFFGTVIPLTVKAKSVVYDLSIIQTMYGAIPSISNGFFYKLISVTLMAFILFLAYKRRKKITVNVITLLGLCGMILLIMYVSRATFIHGWYSPLYLVPIYLFSAYIIFNLENKKHLLTLILLLSPFLYSFSKTAYASVSGKYERFSEFISGARVQQYLDISNKLYTKYPNARLMTSEIGGLGYGFRGHVIDGMGLIQPDCLKYHPMKIPEERTSGGIGAIPTKCVGEHRPEIVVSYDVFIQHFLKSNVVNLYNHYKLPVFTEFDLQQTRKRQIWGSKHLNIFIRKDIDDHEMFK